MKKCSRCGEHKTEDSFHKNKNSKDGLTSRCKECAKAASRAWNADNREQVAERNAKRYRDNPDPQWNRHYRKSYGITLIQYREILKSRGGVCAVCRNPDPVRERLAVDHDHVCCPGKNACGKCVRGLLCSRCNQGLGHFEDDVDRMMSAIEYIRSHR